MAPLDRRLEDLVEGVKHSVTGAVLLSQLAQMYVESMRGKSPRWRGSFHRPDARAHLAEDGIGGGLPAPTSPTVRARSPGNSREVSDAGLHLRDLRRPVR
jgi:hypothetical protein